MVLATGSFDASVGVWKREDDTGIDRDGTGFEVAESHEGEEREEEEEWRFALVLDGHDSEVKSVAWSAAGNFLATCSRDKSVWIWEEVAAEDYETIAVLQEHTGDVKCVSWHPEEELLASASYDDDVRLWKEDADDWGCVAVLKGHEGTVWAVEWEGVDAMVGGEKDAELVEEREKWNDRRRLAGPRLLSCSDDTSIRVWRRRPRVRQVQNQYSIIRTGGSEEDWIEETRLPKAHERTIYSVAWSKKSGLVVSAGGDGKIVVYMERWSRDSTKANGHFDVQMDQAELKQNTALEPDPDPSAATSNGVHDLEGEQSVATTDWIVLAEVDGAHGVFEINHVCWARRSDRGRLKDDEEIILSTGDDGAVKVWSLDV